MCYGYKQLASMQGAEEFYEENIESYDEAREEGWDDYINVIVMAETPQTELSGYISKQIKENYKGNYNACDLSEWLLEEAARDNFLAGLYTSISENLDDFEFPGEGEWVSNEYEGTLGSIEDQCYEEARDRAMRL